MRRGMTLREVSAKARVSLGYISEVERGQKEPSSELLAALCEALEVSLSRVLRDVSVQLEVAEQLETLVPDDAAKLAVPVSVG
ncbi:helix-turn-helix transcriptional regulator [Nocardioidaceae bacterium SCSIO 66511]|nr:helix-turn-helix transcriptional regulator [Nocardioidaceae bacterium SCSIO 66511]